MANDMMSFFAGCTNHYFEKHIVVKPFWGAGQYTETILSCGF